jgi:hypothetical protein
MHFEKVAAILARVAVLAVMTFGCAKTGHAQTVADVSGRYDCAEMKIAGKSVPCTVATLDFKNDGRFEVRGREGSYLVNGGWVELNNSILKSRAKIEAGHKIVFRYYSKRGLCEITFERRVAELGKRALS